MFAFLVAQLTAAIVIETAGPFRAAVILGKQAVQFWR